jgi:hypothetical protein
MIRHCIFMFMLLPFLLCGCLEVSHQIVVNKDGSGKIIERFAMSKAVIAQMNALFSSFPSADGKKEKPIDLYDKKKLKEDAANYGPGVTYVTSKRINTGTKEGYQVEYAFKDINKVRIDQNPSDKTPTAPDKSSSSKQEPITFRFEKGSPATLTVVFPKEVKKPKKKRRSKEAGKTKAAQKKEADELREIFKDFYIGITVRPQGTIVDTNATYNEGGTVTLLEMDFKKLLTNEKEFQSFIKKEPETVEEAKALLKHMPGFKIELNREIKISFE